MGCSRKLWWRNYSRELCDDFLVVNTKKEKALLLVDLEDVTAWEETDQNPLPPKGWRESWPLLSENHMR